MKIEVEIRSCYDCRYLGHSGAFTKGGAKLVCEHPDALPSRIHGDDKYHWRHRVVNGKKIPSWCPLRHGSQY